MYKVLFEKKIYKFLEKHKGEKIIFELEKVVEILKINPYKNKLDIKQLKGYKKNYRLRIGKYRFIYEIIDKQLIIYFIKGDTRGDIY